MRIGVISDTHGTLSQLAATRLDGCDHIIHAGDICAYDVLARLESIAPVTAVLGNCDWNDYGPGVRREALVELDGLRFFVTHKPDDLHPSIATMDVGIHGHTHVAGIHTRHGVLVVNPGSASRPRDGAPSLAIIETTPGRVAKAEIIRLA